MLYNLEPDRSITGGAWYSENEFESEFVEILNVQCYRILQQKAEQAKVTLVMIAIVLNDWLHTIRFFFKYL